MFRRWQQHSVESAHNHPLSKLDCNDVAEVPSFTLPTALSAIPFVSELCGVDVVDSENFISPFCVSEKFLFSIGRVGQILYHHGMFVARFSFFTCGCQVTNIFCSGLIPDSSPFKPGITNFAETSLAKTNFGLSTALSRTPSRTAHVFALFSLPRSSEGVARRWGPKGVEWGLRPFRKGGGLRTLPERSESQNLVEKFPNNSNYRSSN